MPMCSQLHRKVLQKGNASLEMYQTTGNAYYIHLNGYFYWKEIAYRFKYEINFVYKADIWCKTYAQVGLES